MIIIDGSFGEGGGQILRSSLALSLVTGKPFRIEKIRAGRKQPGLLRQHLTAVNAAVEIGSAKVSGNRIGSLELEFIPSGIKAGSYHFAVGTAGSTTLVLQTVLPALLIADKPSELILEGGTHNPFAPPFGFLEKVFVPVLKKMGADIQLNLERPGFYPAGGGRIGVTVKPCGRLQPIEILTRGEILRKKACAYVANLQRFIAEREVKVIASKLNWDESCLEIVEVADSQGPGNIVTVEIESEHITELFTGFGTKGVTSEQVAIQTVDEVKAYLLAGVPVGPYLADQLMIPMVMAGRGRFVTMNLTPHATTNISIIQQFLDIGIDVVKKDKKVYEVKIGKPA